MQFLPRLQVSQIPSSKCCGFVSTLVREVVQEDQDIRSISEPAFTEVVEGICSLCFIQIQYIFERRILALSHADLDCTTESLFLNQKYFSDTKRQVEP